MTEEKPEDMVEDLILEPGEYTPAPPEVETQDNEAD